MMKVLPIIYIVDDDASFRTAISGLLRACGYRVALYESAKQLLKTPPSGEPGCILLDVEMPGLSGPQLQDHLNMLGCKVPVVFVSGQGSIQTTVQTIKAGAEDFLTKPVPKTTLLEAIKRALVRYEKVREHDRRITNLRSLFSLLTPREHQVFELLVRGNPHKRIAHALGTSERTVKLHRHNLMQKLEVQSLAELAVIAERLGLLALPSGSRNENLEHAERESKPENSNPSLTRHYSRHSSRL